MEERVGRDSRHDHLAAPTSGQSAQIRWHVLAFVLLTLSAYLPTATYHDEQNNDVSAVAIPVWSVVERGTVDVRPYQDATPWFFEANGRYVSNRWPGTMLVALPAYLLASPWVAADEARLWPASVMAAVVAALAVTTLFALVLTMHGRRTAWIAGVVIAFGTGMWTVAADSLWTHGPAVLAIGLALHALRRGRQWLAGCCFGFMGLVRLHLLTSAAITGYVLARDGRDPRALLRIGLPSAIGLLLYMVYAGYLRGDSLAALPYTFVTPTGWGRLVNVAGMLVAPRVGLLVYTPVIVVCILKLGRAWREAAAWEHAAFLAGAVYLVVQVQSNFFWGGFSFYGYRLPLEGLALMVPVLVRGAVAFAAGGRVRQEIMAGLATYSVWVGAVGAILYDGSVLRRLPPWTAYGPVVTLTMYSTAVVVVAVGLGVCALIVLPIVVRHRRRYAVESSG